MSYFNDDPSVMLQGAFIKAWKLIKRNTELEEDHKFIKITEIKNIQCNGEGHCIFSTYKDVRFYSAIGDKDLIIAINKFIFKPDDYFYDYMEEK